MRAVVQTSYRAELRAMAQALARCKCIAFIYNDCNTIVKQINRYRSDGMRITTGTAPQLWSFIYDMLDLVPESDLAVQWIPSHLDDPKRKL